jgi:hypothetical protein
MVQGHGDPETQFSGKSSSVPVVSSWTYYTTWVVHAEVEGLMLLHTHSYEKAGCDEVQWVYQLSTLKPEKEATI